MRDKPEASSRRHPRALIAVVSTLVLACVLAAVAVAGAGDLTQKPGTAGCVSDSGSGGGGACADGVALDGAYWVTVSPDGTSAYVASYDNDSVAVFDRAPDGTLTQKPGTAGCVSNDGSGGACADGVALNGASSITVAPDGTSAYVASRFSDAVAVFDRAPDGTLTQKPGTAGCVSDDGTGGACADGVALDGASSVSVAPDGTSAYVTSFDGDAVAVFDRAPNGTLTQKPGTAGCVSDDGTGGACADGVALNGAYSVTVAPDGASVYVASDGSSAVAAFDRAPDGTLTQKPGTAACVSNNGTGGACADGVALGRASSVTVAPDGTSAYAPAYASDSVAVFDRASATPPTPTAPPTTSTTPTPPTAPSNQFAFGRLKRNANKGIAHLQMLLPGPGQIGYRGKGEARAGSAGATVSRDVSAAGEAWFKIKPGRFGRLASWIRRKLKRGNGKAKVKVFVTYAPAGGASLTKRRKLRLVRK